jgi:hypothetical protein
MDAGFDLHLVKPVDLKLLLDALGEQATMRTTPSEAA